MLADTFHIVREDGTRNHDEAPCRARPLVDRLLDMPPLAVVHLVELRANVGHQEALFHGRLVPAHIHRGRHVAAGVTTLFIVPPVGTTLHVVVSLKLVVGTILGITRVGHRRHGVCQFIGHTVGHAVILVEIDHNRLVVDRLVIQALRQFHVEQRRVAR